MTPLPSAAFIGSNIDAHALLNAGVRAEARTVPDGFTVLQTAISLGQPRMVKSS